MCAACVFFYLFTPAVFLEWLPFVSPRLVRCLFLCVCNRITFSSLGQVKPIGSLRNLAHGLLLQCLFPRCLLRSR